MRGWLLIGLCALGACVEPLPSVDGAAPMDGGSGDLGVPPDAGGRLGAAFTIIGCAALDETTATPRCTGAAPLELTFVPLGSGVSTFVWSFPGGDPSSSKAISPAVRYAAPGRYTVQLAAGGPAGTTTATGTVMVTAGGVGAPCEDSSECDVTAGLSCLCAGGTCPGGLAVGLCTRSCTGGGCAAGQACVDLTRGAPPAPTDSDGGIDDGGATVGAWRAAICLPGCATDADCRPGFSCRELPVLATGAGPGGAYAWSRACFAQLLGDDGASCFDAEAAPDPSECLSGRCDPLGARGLCTSSCASVACPSFATCATFVGTPSDPVCLVRCDAQHPCADPLMACEAPGHPGDFGFTVAPGDPPNTTYCAPKPCSQPADCAPAGSCTPMGGGSFCTRS